MGVCDITCVNIWLDSQSGLRSPEPIINQQGCLAAAAPVSRPWRSELRAQEVSS